MRKSSKNKKERNSKKNKMTPWLLLHPTYFSPWPLIVSLMTTGSIWPTERKGKKEKKKPGRGNNQEKASKKKQYSHNFIWIPYGKREWVALHFANNILFIPLCLHELCLWPRAISSSPHPTPRGLFLTTHCCFPSSKVGHSEEEEKGSRRVNPLFPLLPSLKLRKKSLFLAEGFLFVWSFCEGKDTECQKIISLEGKTV